MVPLQISSPWNIFIYISSPCVYFLDCFRFASLNSVIGNCHVCNAKNKKKYNYQAL